MSKTSRLFKKRADEGKTVKELNEELKTIKDKRPKVTLDLFEELGIKYIDEEEDTLGIKWL